MFCSELVAALYQRLGVLDVPFPARYDYVPADFAQSLGHPVGRLGIDSNGEDATTKDDADIEVRKYIHGRCGLIAACLSYLCRKLKRVFSRLQVGDPFMLDSQRAELRLSP